MYVLYAGAGVNGTEAPSGHWWDGRLFGQQVLPFVDMTVKGWVWLVSCMIVITFTKLKWATLHVYIHCYV